MGTEVICCMNSISSLRGCSNTSWALLGAVCFSCIRQGLRFTGASADAYGKGILWVTRCKAGAQFNVIKKLNKGRQKNIIRDELIEWKGDKSHKRYPEQLRRGEAWVKDTQGEEVRITFLTNNAEWSASSVCGLYRTRWAIENFFMEIKQTLQLRTFIGYNRNSIEWQVWSAMLIYMLLRIQEWMHK